MVAVVIVVQQW